MILMNKNETQYKELQNMNKTQIKRYAKAVQSVENRTDLNPEQKEFYLDTLNRSKESVLSYDKTPNGWGTLITYKLANGKTKKGFFSTHHFGDVQDWLIGCAIDHGICTPTKQWGEDNFVWSFSDEVVEYKVKKYQG